MLKGLARRGQGAGRRRCRDIGDDERHGDCPQPPSARRVAAGRHRFLCRFSSTMQTGIASSRSQQTLPYLWNETLSEEVRGKFVVGSFQFFGDDPSLPDHGNKVGVSFPLLPHLVSRSIDTMTFADGSCQARSRSEEETMQGHRRQRETRRSTATSISPKGGGGTASISLSLLLHDADWHRVVALPTNVTVFMERDTK